MIQTGQLDTHITVQAKTVTPDTGGGFAETWADASVLWAAKVVNGSREFIAAGKRFTETDTIFTVRYTESVTDSNRIKVGSEIYNLTGRPYEVGRTRKTEMRIETKRLA